VGRIVNTGELDGLRIAGRFRRGEGRRTGELLQRFIRGEGGKPKTSPGGNGDVPRINNGGG